MKTTNGDKVKKKASIRQKRVTISDDVLQGWSEDCKFIISRARVTLRKIYRKMATSLDVDILTVKNAFLLKLATQKNIDRITKFLEKWKSKI